MKFGQIKENKSFMMGKMSDDDVYHLSDKLSKHFGGVGGHEHIDWYSVDSENSGALNRNLIAGKPLTPKQSEVHNFIKRQAKPSGHSYSVYSGTTTKFGTKIATSVGSIMHSPAHISASHDRYVALEHVWGNMEHENKDVGHILKIDIEPHNKVLFAGSNSDLGGDEHETIIPSGTKLRYHGTVLHKPDSEEVKMGSANVYKVHHFTIHSQE